MLAPMPDGHLGGGLPELSVVIPTRNEADNLDALLTRLERSLAGVDYELIFVDDSDDGTPERLQQLGGTDGRICCFHRRTGDRAGGLSTAVTLGLARVRGRAVCVMDADLQHPPETVPQLLAAQRDGADLVVASRYMSGGSREGLSRGVRQLVSRVATWLVRALFREARASSDPLAGFFLCPASLVRGLELRPTGFKILLELLVCSPGVKVVDVPLRFQSRAGGESKASARQGWLFLRHVWSLMRDVPGSARRWKFVMVGASGLLLFLALLQLLGVVADWVALAAWSVAFCASLTWNFALNLRITFADLRRDRYPFMHRYIGSSLTAGGTQLILFLGLVGTSLPLVVDGLLAAVASMGVNGMLNSQLVHQRLRRPPRALDLPTLLQELPRLCQAQLAWRYEADQPLPAGLPRPLPSAVAALAARAVAGSVPVIWTEAQSLRAQARRSVELTSLMVLPFDDSDGSHALILYRYSPLGFSTADLHAALRQLQRLQPLPTPTSAPAASPAV